MNWSMNNDNLLLATYAIIKQTVNVQRLLTDYFLGVLHVDNSFGGNYIGVFNVRLHVYNYRAVSSSPD